MYLQILICLLPLLLKSAAKPVSNITVIGSVFCDSCSENTYSKRSYFLKGAKVHVQCTFGETLVAANRTTDKYGVYNLNIHLPGRYECYTKSACQVILIQSPPSPCNLTGILKSATNIAIQPRHANMCILNMNALTSRPLKRDDGYCRTHGVKPQSGALDSSLFFFWPIYPPLGLPWLCWPPLPSVFPPLPFPFNSIPLPDPTSLPFSPPPWLLPFLDPTSLPFPFSLFPPLIPIPTFSTAPPPPYPFSHGQP